MQDDNGQALDIRRTGQDELATIDERVALIKAMRARVMAVTEPQDWKKFGATMYPLAEGLKRISFCVGVNTRVVGQPQEFTHETEDGQLDTTYVATCEVWQGVEGEPGYRVHQDIGVCSLSDKFFAGDGAGGKKRLCNVNRANVIRKAQTNGIGRALKGFLAIGNLTEADLGKSVDTTQVKAVAIDADAEVPAELENDYRAKLTSITTNPKECDTLFVAAACFVGPKDRGDPDSEPRIVKPGSLAKVLASERWRENAHAVLDEAIAANPSSPEDCLEFLQAGTQQAYEAARAQWRGGGVDASDD